MRDNDRAAPRRPLLCSPAIGAYFPPKGLIRKQPVYNRCPNPRSEPSMIVERERPVSWQERKKQIPRWCIPFFALDLVWDWIAYILSRWSFLVVLEYIGNLSILVAVFFYFHES